jgi:hypothetical protein
MILLKCLRNKVPTGLKRFRGYILSTHILPLLGLSRQGQYPGSQYFIGLI